MGGAAGEQEAFMEQMEKLHPSNAGLAALKAEPVRDRAAVLMRDKKSTKPSKPIEPRFSYSRNTTL